MKQFYTCLLICFLTCSLSAQDPLRFAEEVKKFENTAGQYPTENRIVFTGSSSIRLWVDFKSYFPNHNVINTGFGGSETSDLLHYKDLLTDQFKPRQVFIYEGDNDINAGEDGLAVFLELIILAGELLEDEWIEQIVFISPKPSIARWHLKEEYENVIAAMREAAAISDRVVFADVWTPMLNPDGSLMEDLFIDDGLHMNKKGYDLWIKVIHPILIKSK